MQFVHAGALRLRGVDGVYRDACTKLLLPAKHEVSAAPCFLYHGWEVDWSDNNGLADGLRGHSGQVELIHIPDR